MIPVIKSSQDLWWLNLVLNSLYADEAPVKFSMYWSMSEKIFSVSINPCHNEFV